MALLSLPVLTSSVHAGGNTKTAKEIGRLLTTRIANLGTSEYVLTATEFSNFMGVATRDGIFSLHHKNGRKLRDQLVDLYLQDRVKDNSELSKLDNWSPGYAHDVLIGLSQGRIEDLFARDDIDAVEFFKGTSAFLEKDSLYTMSKMLSSGKISRDAITAKAKGLVNVIFTKRVSSDTYVLISADDYSYWEHKRSVPLLKLLVEYGADDSRIERILKIAEEAKARKWKRLRRVVGIYLASQIVVPLGFYVTVSTRNPEVQAERFLEERITKGSAENMVIYNQDGVQQVGVVRERPKWQLWGSDDEYKVAPLSVNRTFSFADGAVAADGWWGLLNSDVVPDIFTAKKIDRDEVISVSIAGRISGEVLIEDEGNMLRGQGVVKLADKYSDEELYAVLVKQTLKPKTVQDTGEEELGTQEIDSYFIFLSAAEFAEGKALAQQMEVAAK